MPKMLQRPCSNRGCPLPAAPGGGLCIAHLRERRREYAKGQPSSTEAGYGVEWRNLRESFLEDHPTCVICGAKSTIPDHVIPKSLGGADDETNLQALCTSCHNTKTATRDGGGWKTVNARRGIGIQSMPQGTGPPRQGEQTAHVTVVCGPPGSGKTRYVAERAHGGDLIVDLDALYVALSGLDMYDKPLPLLPFAREAKDAVIARLRRRHDVQRAWIITGGADRDSRDKLRVELDARVVVLETTEQVCLSRIQNDPRRKTSWELWKPIVDKWWRDYEPSLEDERIKT